MSRATGPIKIVRKLEASKEVWGKLTGIIDTQEKFEARRMTMATREWARMKASDSRECRNCHSFDAMSEELQRKTPFKKHMSAKAEGKTCIDCHKELPTVCQKNMKNRRTTSELHH